jgi:hypothetical protein
MFQPNQTDSPPRSQKECMCWEELNKKWHTHLQEELKNKINDTKAGQSKYDEMITKHLRQ